MAKAANQNVSPQFLRLQQDLKRTQFGVRFARVLFTGGNGALSQKFIRAGFKAMGVDIPESVELTLDVAQMIVSGAATMEAIRTYENFDDIRSVTSNAVGTLAAATQVFQALGWLDKGSDEAQIIRTATNAALIIGSGGLDVKAWLALALDLTSFESQNTAKAKQRATQLLISNYKNIVTPQSAAAAGVLKDYQEKKMSSFAFVGKMAEAAPDLWPQYFPQFGKWSPVYDRTLWVTAENRSWYGSSSGQQRAEHTWRSIAGYSPDQIRTFIFQFLAEPILFPYFIANEFYEGTGKATLQTVALLGALGMIDEISTGDMSEVLIKNQVTLADFSDPLMIEKIKTATAQAGKKSVGISVNGEEWLTTSETLEQKQAGLIVNNRAIFEAAEMAGRIDIVTQSAELRAALSKAMTFGIITPTQAYGAWNEAGTVSYGRGGSETKETLSLRTGGAGAIWRNPKNYFAALAMISDLKNDGYFNGMTGDKFGFNGVVYGGRSLESYDFMGTVKDFEQAHREITMKVAMRKTNALALANVAFYLDTTPENLVRVNRNNQTESAVYDKRG